MDTNDLSDMAYESIVIAARFNDYLKAELGAMSYQCKEEDEYLKAMLNHVVKIRNNPTEYLQFWNIEDETDIASFKHNIDILEKYIERTIQTPIIQRKRS